MYSFEYHNPASQKEAEELLASTDNPSLLAGGQTLLPALKHRLAEPSDLIDLKGIDGLSGIREENGAIVIGAATTHCEVSESELVAKRIPALAKLAGGIGDQQVRHRGTIGGSVANNDPAADYPAGCVGLGATIRTNRREMGADNFFVDLFETALGEDEMILAVSFPIPDQAAYIKFPNPASRYALVGVMLSKTGGDVRVAITGAGSSGVFRDSHIETALSKDFSVDAIDGSGVDEAEISADIHASAEYRKHLIGEMARRAVEAASGS
ncbi:FAD binding domain-containing protein [Pseudohalocynthiibacter aestuariivivens]|uniref:FAD binding domain-containing protein n=1 Tax=Pseudohalocynthiibacter aestuariivivens TaxID=1591409 RepID=A0ABV5JED4_9RHOB|nr:xanthine dehydrogenase family protein subunit M [Pseudohalocynthiibacter aestuariivivens]MBS9718812.1 xanthine dehydrogenase family protein subunit M [Pseudohalocynthiibacter aestuariivivens]